MPFYDLHCVPCNKDFNISASVAEKMEKQIVCPDCGSNDMETIYKPINIHTKRTQPSSSCPNRHVCGEGCCHSH